jgi:hypothetical protein
MLRAVRSRVQFTVRTLIFFFKLPKRSSRITTLGLTLSLKEMSTRKFFWGVESGQQVRLTIPQPSESRLSRKCGIREVSQIYRSQQPAIWIALFFFFYAVCILFSCSAT